MAVLLLLLLTVACSHGYVVNSEDPASTFALKPLRIAGGLQTFTPMNLENKCICTKNACACCADLDIPQLQFNHTGCLNFTYFPNDFAVKLDLLVSNSSIFSARISGKNPPALCIPIPQLPILSMCIKLYDVHTDDDSLYACLNMELQLQGLTLIVFNFDCARFSHSGITLIKPTPKPPSENGQLEVDLSLANLDQATKSSTTTKAPGWLLGK